MAGILVEILQYALIVAIPAGMGFAAAIPMAKKAVSEGPVVLSVSGSFPLTKRDFVHAFFRVYAVAVPAALFGTLAGEKLHMGNPIANGIVLAGMAAMFSGKRILLNAVRRKLQVP